MPECHNCPAYLNPQYRKMPFEKTPCAKCRLSDEPRHAGKSHVSRDSSDAVEADESIRSLAVTGDVHDSLTDAFLMWITEFMRLPPLTRDLVAKRLLFPQVPMRVMARKHGITVQAAHSRIRRALDHAPALKSVLIMQEYRRSNDTSTTK